MQSRQRLGVKFIAVLAADFELHGEETIETLRENDPAGYAQIPKHGPRCARFSTSSSASVSRANLSRCSRWIEQDLRARVSKTVSIEHSGNDKQNSYQ